MKEDKKNNPRKSCRICGIYYCASKNNGGFLMANFPRQVERCRKWVKFTGDEKLLSATWDKIQRYYVCAKHFSCKDFNRKKNRLKKNAVPSLNLSRPPLDDELLENFPAPRKYTVSGKAKDSLYHSEFEFSSKEYLSGIERIPEVLRHDHFYWFRAKRLEFSGKDRNEDTSGTNIKAEYLDTDPMEDNTKQSNDDQSEGTGVSCTEVEYLEDAASDGSDNDDITKPDYTNLKYKDTETPSKALFEHNFKLTLDEIDFLFLSYAKTFRSLAKQFQTMLKLDIAKLFARYEMKNISLSKQEASQPNQPPTVPVVKPSLMAVNPPLLPAKPPQEIQPIFIPTKEKNKKIFRRVPFQAVIAGMPKAAPVESSPQVVQQNPRIIRQQIPPQAIHSKEITVNTIQKRTISDNIPEKLDPTANLERQKANSSEPSTSLELNPTPPHKVMKYYLPKKGPAYAIISKNSVQAQEMMPDLNMEVSEPVHTETVFVTTDHVNFSEDET